MGFAVTSADVVRVVSTISGAGIATPISTQLSLGGGQASGTILNIPAGTARTVLLGAYPADPEGSTVIWRGQTSVDIAAGQVAQAALTLFPVTGDVPVTATFPANDVDVARIHHVSVVVSGNRIDAPATFYLTLSGSTATGNAAKIPVGATRTVTVKSFASDGTLLHQGSADIAVAESGNSAAIAMANATGAGGASVDAGFCTPTCGSAVCGSDGCGGSCGGCMPGASCVGGACVTTFDVTSASAASGTSITLGFSSAPDATQAAATANYCIASGTPATCTGDLAVSAASVSGSTVTLTTAAQAAGQLYTVFVSGVTRGADGQALTTSSAQLTGYPAFTVAAAGALSATSVEVTYSHAYTAGGAAEQAASYLVGDASDSSCATGALAVSAAVASASNKVKLTVASMAGNHAYRVCVTGAVTRASDGFALATATAPFSGFNLIANGSFETDTAAPPSGWTMLSGSTGTLTASAGAVAAHEGANVASFASLASSSFREARSGCLPVQAGTLTYTGWLRTSAAVTHTKAAFKIYWFTEATCATASTHASDVQGSFSLAAVDTWQLNTYAQAVPADAKYAYVSVRAQFVSSIGASTDPVWFDDLAAQQ